MIVSDILKHNLIDFAMQNYTFSSEKTIPEYTFPSELTRILKLFQAN